MLFLTMHEDESLLHEALRAGAAGYVIKRAEESEIIQAIHAASRGDIYVHPAMTRALLHQPVTTEHRRGAPADALTRRELDVLRLLAKGNTNRQIADLLGPLDPHGREPPRQPDGQARAGQPGRAGELRRGARPALTARRRLRSPIPRSRGTARRVSKRGSARPAAAGPVSPPPADGRSPSTGRRDPSRREEPSRFGSTHPWQPAALLPRRRGLALRCLPALGEVGLDLVPLACRIDAPGFPAVAVRILVVGVRPRRVDVLAGAVRRAR